MKLWKKILLGLFAIVALVQIPFVYRRYKVGKLAETIAGLASQRVARTQAEYREYRGVIHVHTSLGGHSRGSFDELISAATSSGLDFVIMNEHFSETFDTSALTLAGVHGTTLFVAGNEVDTGDKDRFLIVPGRSEAESYRRLTTSDFLQTIHAQNGLAFVAYPETFNSWQTDFDGIEVFSLYTSGRQMSRLMTPLDLVWSFPAYPGLTFAQSFKRPDANMQKFDEIASRRRITLFAGTDAHSNLGFHIFGDDAGNALVNFKLDPYATLFGLTQIHILLKNGEKLDRDSLIAALKQGHFYTGFDVFGDTSGFSFAVSGNGQTAIGGDEIQLGDNLKLTASSPLPARFAVFQNGARYFEQSGTEIELELRDAGAYRVEVYLDALGAPLDGMPWIMSNPIYVR